MILSQKTPSSQTEIRTGHDELEGARLGLPAWSVLPEALNTQALENCFVCNRHSHKPLDHQDQRDPPVACALRPRPSRQQY